MRYLLQLFLLTALSGLVLAQSDNTITGKVVDASGEGMIGVNVFVDGRYDGTTTDFDGAYSFTTEAAGEQTILFQFLGYEDQQHVVNLTGPAPVTLSVTLEEGSIQLAIAKVSAGRFGKTSDQQRTEVLSTLDILTTGGANADVVSALRTMPGTQQIGEQEGLFVRGGSGDETRIFMDGMAVTNFFQSGADNVAQRGRFSPDLFQGTFFSSGGFSAAYGQALSGSLNLESVDMPVQSKFSASVNTVGGQAEVTKLFNENRSAVAASVNYVNLQPYYGLVDQDRTYDKMPVFVDGSINLRHKTSETGVIKYFGQVGGSELAFRRESLDYSEEEEAFGVENRNIYSNLLYDDMLGDDWKFSLGAGYSHNDDDILREEPMADHHRTRQSFGRETEFYQGRGTLSWLGNNNQKIIAGGEYQRWDRTDRADSLSREYREDYSAIFMEGTFPLFKKFSARLGLRGEYNGSIERYNLAPRFALSYDLTKQQQLSFAWGQYHQAPDLLYSKLTDGLNYQRATHYILTYQVNQPRRTFRTELFHKEYSDLLKTAPEITNAGFGYARGLELFWRDKTLAKNLDYWISYSYLDTERDYLDFPITAQPTFAAAHTTSIAVKKFFPAWGTNLSATFSYATGRPYHNPNLPADKFLSARTSSYRNLSFTAAHLTKIGGAFTTLVFSINNVLGTEQIFGYEYGTLDTTRRRAVTPTAPRFFYFGAFFNWGIDQRNKTLERFL
ncbi:MAG: vitamin B12 transporter [Neolewinella sp.]|jgi:vitamin B12 transporter